MPPEPLPSDAVRIDVAAGLVFRDHRLLITQRFLQAHLGGLWEFPGGKREPHETFVDCLHRELLEELGIEVDIGRLLESMEHQYPEKTVLLKFYVCRWRRHEPQAIGCLSFEWITRGQLDRYSFPPADARLLAILRNLSELW